VFSRVNISLYGNDGKHISWFYISGRAVRPPRIKSTKNSFGAPVRIAAHEFCSSKPPCPEFEFPKTLPKELDILLWMAQSDG
jgi:hypothetical protein